jgi:single-strand DNA-binding protein
MNNLNSVLIEGNACRDAVVKTTASGAAICKMSIAVNRYYKSGENFEKEVSFFDIDSFGEVARLCGEKVKRGSEIRVTGRLKQNRWEQDGQKRTAVIVIAEHVEFSSKAKADASDSPALVQSGAGIPVDDEGLPF